ncbi:hypothetical protein KOR42_18610 [Thalassoglobus neptunius]|uniref:Caspase domain protein n=1 Tax=Thalassoglobus neptunius TaxID=1938619 RepID=A0A5C5X637_9PLAN|nr:hypothetical protein [Thalassoglobus neptunius]TWT58486.1 hypothetical protein KOR42_18610 [Thalassoglobus neptunius]
MIKQRFLLSWVLACLLIVNSAPADEDVEPAGRGDLLIVVGEAGTSEYGEQFESWANRWEEAAAIGQFQIHTLSDSKQPREEFAKTLKELSKGSDTPLWIVWLGHGTFDGRTAKFNLPGPDITASEVQELLKDCSRLVVSIHCTAASAPFLDALSGENRIIVTATRSGDQVSFSHFGEFLSAAISDLNADLDKDQQVSLLEAFLIASRRVEEFYEADGRIPTENALIDDNGDGIGTRAAAFQGFRVKSKPQNSEQELDGLRAHQQHLIANERDRLLSPEQLARRNEIEVEIESLRSVKETLSEDEYYDRLEALFLQLGELLLPQHFESVEAETEEQREANDDPSSDSPASPEEDSPSVAD